MRKIVILAILGMVWACAGPLRKPDIYPKPIPEKEAKRLVNEATLHIGEPYHFGGTSRKGWDCSGFIYTIYQRSLKINLPRTANDMFLSSQEIPVSRARPGDLVFFRIRHKKASHVGIYIGKESFIHVSTLDGVIISALDDPYYRRYLIGLRRISLEQIVLAR